MTDYLTVEYFAMAYGLNDGEDDRPGSRRSSDDFADRVRAFVGEANREVTRQLKPFAGRAPLHPGDPYWQDARDAAYAYAVIMFHHRINHIRGEHLDNDWQVFRTLTGSLITALRAERTTRTRTFMASADPRREKLRLPSQRDAFVLGDF